MAKKVKSKKRTSKRTKKKPKKRVYKSRITQTSSEVQVEKILVENFVALQKVMTNLSVKFDDLSNQISKLLELFEISAKALAEKEFNIEKGNFESKKVLDKIDNLIDQNKTIARGLTLMNEHNLMNNSSEGPRNFNPPVPRRGIPMPKESPNSPRNTDYQRSILSKSDLEG